jgi:hypothetical protein
MYRALQITQVTPSKIRHILTGLKQELSRETDRERRVNLAELGLYWSEKNRTYTYPILIEPVDTMICVKCGREKPLKHFKEFERQTSTGLKKYRLKACNGCWNKVRYAYKLSTLKCGYNVENYLY